MKNKPALAGLLAEELSALLDSYPAYRSRQIHEWICRGAVSFDEMKNLPLPIRKELEERFTLIPGTQVSELLDSDGTVKLGIEFKDKAVIEAVILSDGKDRKTACLSTQAGCPMGCVFCKTGMIGFKRNLSAAEITGQFLRLKKIQNGISHIVVMGMGEPLLNLNELKAAIDFFSDPSGLNISKRRITLSTCGIVDGIRDLAEHGPDVRLALSLTTARESLRRELMPAAKDNPLPLLKEALRAYQQKTRRRVTLEMVLLGGVNTGPEDAKAAADFSRGLKTVINLIPWNAAAGLEFKGAPLKTPSPAEIADFTSALESAGLKVTRRIEKGLNISGACGQLGVVPAAADNV